MRISVVTIASEARRSHLETQLAAVGRAGVHRVVVWLDVGDAPPLDADAVLTTVPGQHGMRLAAARNTGADRAFADGAELVVFLDADCVPGPQLLSRYSRAASARPGAVLCGPVTYLADGVDATDLDSLDRARSPHPARPDPAPGVLLTATPDQYPLFWSLSFALTRDVWRTGLRFDEGFEGYGGEDTDFAFRLREAGIPLIWVGGADAFHQYHPSSNPPVEHLDDILRNGARFAARWGTWPMSGWLEAFERQGLVTRTSEGWTPAPALAD